MLFESLYMPNEFFTSWSFEHNLWLAYAILSTVGWIYWGRQAPTVAQQQRIGTIMALVGVAAWLYSEIMMLWHGQVDKMSFIPLHLCYFLNLLLPYMVRKRHFAIFDWVYPIVMAGCLQALITPDLKSAFPNFFSIKYWVVHIGLVQSVLYCVFVYRFRPTFSGIFKCLLGINIYAAICAVFNWLLDTNFLYLRKPAAGTLMELLGPWPWYLVGLEILSVVLFFVVWLPFARRR